MRKTAALTESSLYGRGHRHGLALAAHDGTLAAQQEGARARPTHRPRTPRGRHIEMSGLLWTILGIIGLVVVIGWVLGMLR
jgi:hypothetical protein